jgi:hypothetical protein
MTVTAMKKYTRPAPKRPLIARLCNSDLVAISPAIRALAHTISGDAARRISGLNAHSVRPIIIADAKRAISDQIDTLQLLADELDRL